MIELRVAEGCRPTGRVLENLLRREGARLGPGGNLVSWGVPLQPGQRPSLNRNASRLDKYNQLVYLHRERVRVPESFIDPAAATAQDPVAARSGAYLARKFRHVGGKDIMPVLQFSDFAARKRAGADFFTKFVPSDQEIRCWMYRKRHLGSYEKFLAHPEKYRKIGRNYGNGFAFRLLQEAAIPRDAVLLAGSAVDALGLDFGAVDLIHGLDGNWYVLEVNTAPGVEGENRQVIASLAHRIAQWDANGCPRRNGDADAPRRQRG